MTLWTILFAILGLGIAIARPKWSIFILLLFYTIRPFLLVIIPDIKIFGDAIILGSLLHVFYINKSTMKNLFSFQLFEYAFFLFLIIGTISALQTGVALGAIITQLRAWGIGYLLFYIVKRLSISKEDLKSFLNILFWWTIVICIHGLIEKLSLRQLLLPEVWRTMELSITNKIRIYGILGNPNVLGLYVMIVTFLTYFFRNLIRAPKIILWIGLGLFLTVFILTYSRGATIGIALFIIFFIFYERNITFIKHVAILIAASFVFSLAVVQTTNWIDYPIKEEGATEPQKKVHEKEEGVSRFTKAFGEENISLSSEDGRLFYIKKGFTIFKDHPIIGTGFATYGDSATQSNLSPIYKQYGIENTLFYTDNQYIQIIVETGTMGVIAFATFLLSLLHYCWKIRRNNFFFPIISFFILGLCVHGFYYNIWENYLFAFFFYFLFGLSQNPHFNKEV